MVTAYQRDCEEFFFHIVKHVERRAFRLMLEDFMKQGFNYFVAEKIARLELYGEP